MSLTRDIIVLLSTYNGEHYMSEQLESLRTQTVADRMHVMMRDDGSTDSTASIPSAMDLSPLTIEVSRGRNLGARDSFSALIAVVPPTARTIMLCDQDDVWRPEKAAVAAAALAVVTDGIPALYCGRSTATDSSLNPIGLTDDAPRGPSLRSALFQNIAPGHTMAFNPTLATLYAETIRTGAVMHDWWLYLLASGLGTVEFDDAPHALYRLHDHNDIGYSITRLKRLRRDLGRLLREDRSLVTRQALAFRQAVGSRLPDDDRAMVDAFLDQKSLARRLDYLRHYPMQPQGRRPPWVSTLLFLAGRYRTA
ncbi:MAG: glycosyltransferase [Propionibacteriaceae bacterium]|jgi:glycosyltransferase involved in cell wall biosynthesis|nr:glycosyltransferase [Propionibacteriaceae bacterium]